MTNNKLTITNKLSILNPVFLEIIDESSSHANHYIRDDESSISHVKIRIYSPQFENKSMVTCHQMIYKLLNDELRSGELHAIKIEIIKE